MSHAYFSQFLEKGKTGLPQTPADTETLGTIFNLIFIFIGALAFFMLVLAGFRYVVSQGDPAKTAEIKNQILYAVVGLVVAGSALFIVNFVLGRF